MIVTFIEVDLLKKIAEIAQGVNGSHVFILPIVQIVCLINAGSHEDCKYCVECGFVDILFRWLNIDNLKKSLIKEILYCMSNFTIDSDEISGFVLGNEAHYKTLLSFCYHTNPDIQREAIWNFCNATKVISNERIYKMVQNNIFKLFADCLAIRDNPSLTLIVFEGLKNVFNKQESIA